MTVTTPVPGPGQPAQTTTIFYDAALREWKITHADRASVVSLTRSTSIHWVRSGRSMAGYGKSDERCYDFRA